MTEPAILVHRLPDLRRPVLITGFDGWSNALDVSQAAVGFLQRSLQAEPFARINGDLFCRYDAARPQVTIEQGELKRIGLPGGKLYAASLPGHQRDVIILLGSEPSLGWQRFVRELMGLCRDLGVAMLIGVGSMFDDVLHDERVVSAMASTDALRSRLRDQGVALIDYTGPGSIHSLIHAEAREMLLPCAHLWTHCPYYLEGTTHYGLVARVIRLINGLAGLEVETSSLERRWKELERQIKELVRENPELEAVIQEIRKARGREPHLRPGTLGDKDQKVIHLRDFLGPR